MSTTPIFDATLADAPTNIWQASNVFPQPVVAETLRESLVRIGHPRFAKGGYTGLSTDYTDWTAINMGSTK